MIDKPKLRINEILAFVAKENGDEGVAAFYDQGTRSWMPLVAGDQERVDSMRQMAQQISNQSGKTIKLLRFSMRSEVETITPQEPRRG